MSSATAVATSVGTAVAVVAGLVACAAVAGYATGRGGVEHAHYTVLRRVGGRTHLPFQLRRYAPCVAAVTRVQGGRGADTTRRMTSQGFRSVAGYIFGGNAQRAPPAASHPLMPVEGGGGGRSIAMTAPVVSAPGGNGDLYVSFIMPSRFQHVDELPVPLTRNVELHELPARVEAVHAFSGAYLDDAATLAMARRLLAALRADGLAPAAAPASGGAVIDGERVELRVYSYDPPWVFPFFRLNELSIVCSGDGVST
jgi:hypothetical protein